MLAAIANAFSEKRTKTARIPGDSGVFLFVLADMSMFGLFFLSFIYERSKNVPLFNESRLALDVNLGAINTIILLTASWFVVVAVQAAKRGKLNYVAPFLFLGFVCGAVFGGIKIYEYADKIQSGISMMSNDFFMFYFILTGIHFIHVIAGMVILAVLWHNARHKRYHGENCKGLESGATYWHMVDLLWIIIFPVLYMLG